VLTRLCRENAAIAPPEILRGHAVGAASAIIGQVAESSTPLVTLKSAISANRILDMPSGEQLPRIC